LDSTDLKEVVGSSDESNCATSEVASHIIPLVGFSLGWHLTASFTINENLCSCESFTTAVLSVSESDLDKVVLSSQLDLPPLSNTLVGDRSTTLDASESIEVFAVSR